MYLDVYGILQRSNAALGLKKHKKFGNCSSRKYVGHTKNVDGNRYIYQMIQKKLNIRSATIHKSIHEDLRTKKLLSRWVLPKFNKTPESEACQHL